MTAAGNELKTSERRRSQRLPFRVPIFVEGRTIDGKPFEEKTYTLEINRHGARIVLQSSAQPGGRVAITNLQTKKRCPFQVVSRPGKPLDKEKGTERGVECLDPRADFWGISFPDNDEPASEPAEMDVLLECSKCRGREPVKVPQEQYQAVITHTTLKRSCSKCEALTDWRVVYLKDNGQEAGSPRPRPTAPAPMSREHRRERRLTMRLPVRIRVEEIGETENLSPSGLAFSSELTMRIDDRVWLTVGYAPGGNEKEVAARILWRKDLVAGKRFLYGVQLEHDK